MRNRLPRLVAASLFLSPLAWSQGYIAAEGGGSVGSGVWAPKVFDWMLTKAGGAGDVVILGVSGADNTAAAAFLAAGANSVQNLAVTAALANTQQVYDAIRAADVIWIRGGNQANYVQWWNDTLTEQAIREVYDAGGAVGGTSAGCAILGELIYDSISGSLSPKEALQNPFSPKLTLTDDFLRLGDGMLFDTHFTERGRQARLAVMLARARADLGLDVLGVGVDDRTAFCVSPDGTAEVIGEGSVTILHRTPETTQVVLPGQPPIVTHLLHTSMTEGYVYDTVSRTVLARPANATLAPTIGPDPSFSGTLLRGSIGLDAAQGQWQVLDGGDDAALFFGGLQVVPGNGALSGSVVSTEVWDSTAWDENRVGGPLLALAQNPGALALLLDGGTQVFARPEGRISVLAAQGIESSTVLVDSSQVDSVAFSVYLSSAGADGPRQSVALEDARMHLIRSGQVYDATAHDVLEVDVVGVGTPGCAGASNLSAAGPAAVGDLGFGMTLDNGPSSGFGALAVGNLPDQFGSDSLGLGVILHVDPASPILLLSTLIADAGGTAVAPLPIPAIPALAGTTFWAQGIWIWAGGPCSPSLSGFSTSNALGLTVQP